jgi:uncharacterized protein
MVSVRAGGCERRRLLPLVSPVRQFHSAIHGPRHSAHVSRFGHLLAEAMGLPAQARVCVEVFAWTHDLARRDDGGGAEHAIDGAAYYTEYAPRLFPFLDAVQHEILRLAIAHHADGTVAGELVYAGATDHIDWDPELLEQTIGCCWDADRLDLPRVGVVPRESRMSTPVWEALLPLAVRLNRRW